MFVPSAVNMESNARLASAFLGQHGFACRVASSFPSQARECAQWENVAFWLANIPCPALDLQLTGDHHPDQPLVWLIGAMVCLLAATWVQLSISAGRDGHIMRCGTIGSCQSAATSEIVKTHVSGASPCSVLVLSAKPLL